MSAPAGPPPGMGSCALCGDDVPTLDLLDHLRIRHPDRYEPPLRWPDGALVVVDETLEPGDFGDERSKP